MKKLIFIILSLISLTAGGKGWNIDWYGSMRMGGTTGEYMPFWARTGEDGILPVRSSGLVSAGTDLMYRHSNGIYFGAGTSLVGALAQKSPLNRNQTYGFVDRLYVSGGWRMLHLDVGLKPRERELSDVSVSGGNFMYSRNARNIPGINAWSDRIYFDRKHIFGIKGNLAHYKMNDNRYVSGTLLHNKSLAAKVALGSKVDLSFCFEHWAQWGGVSKNPKVGPQPMSFKDYMRVFLGNSGGEDATDSDQINVLGNHLGKECIRVDWKHHDFTMTFQYDKPFEDGSGKDYQNAPDGIWSVQCLFARRKAIVTDIVLEFITTTWQSGTVHDRPAITEEEWASRDENDPYYGRVVVGGGDNYFGNSEYRSGWTFHNRIIGLPLILPPLPDETGVTLRPVSTRLRGCHLGVKGMIAERIPYSFKATYTVNFGVYKQSDDSVFASRPDQFSVALETSWPKLFRLPIDVSLGLYGDVGQLYQNSFGMTLKFSYAGSYRF